MKKKRTIIIVLIIILTISYPLLLKKYKSSINEIINNLPYGYTDYYTKEMVDKINEYEKKKESLNLFYIFNTSKFLNSNISNNTCYKTNGLTPSIYIYTYDNSGLFLEKSDGYKDCEIVYIDEKGNAIFDYESKVKIRGNSTAVLDKKPYTIKFSDKRNLINAGEAKKWNLLADAYDPTLLRNNIFLTLAENVGLEYTTVHHYVEVYVDQEYRGCFLLTESVEVGKERVDIDLDDKDFFIEMEKFFEEEDVYYFKTKNKIRFALKEPEEPTDEQLEYYENTINYLDDILFSGDYEKVKECFDLDSFAKMYLVNEFAKTRDFDASSVNFYYKQGKIFAGPVWDFDRSSGNSDFYQEIYYWDELNGEKVSYISLYCRNYNPIFRQLFEYKEFDELYKAYFNEYKNLLINIYEEDGFIDSTIKTYGSIFEKNFASKENGGAGWDISALQDTWQTKPFDTYQENVDYLKDFLVNRYKWLIENQ